jgi:excisionase family DNA binding protein
MTRNSKGATKPQPLNAPAVQTIKAEPQTSNGTTEALAAHSVEWASGASGLSSQTIRRLMRRGELPHLRVGRRRLVLAADLRDFLLARRVAR